MSKSKRWFELADRSEVGHTTFYLAEHEYDAVHFARVLDRVPDWWGEIHTLVIDVFWLTLLPVSFADSLTHLRELIIQCHRQFAHRVDYTVAHRKAARIVSQSKSLTQVTIGSVPRSFYDADECLPHAITAHDVHLTLDGSSEVLTSGTLSSFLSRCTSLVRLSFNHCELTEALVASGLPRVSELICHNSDVASEVLAEFMKTASRLEVLYSKNEDIEWLDSIADSNLVALRTDVKIATDPTVLTAPIIASKVGDLTLCSTGVELHTILSALLLATHLTQLVFEDEFFFEYQLQLLVGAPKKAPIVRLEFRTCFDWEDTDDEEIRKYLALSPLSEIDTVILTDDES